MEESNKELRAYSKSKGVTFWMIANEMHISEASMTRKMRAELTEAEAAAFRSIVDKLAERS